VPACSDVNIRNEPGTRALISVRASSREMKAGVDVDGAHRLPGLVGHGQCMVLLVPLRRGAVHEVRHAAHRCSRGGQQAIALVAARQIADPLHGQIGSGRRRHGGSDRVFAHVGEHGANAFSDQGLGDGAADAIAGAGDQRGVVLGVEWVAQQAHGAECCHAWRDRAARARQLSCRVQSTGCASGNFQLPLITCSRGRYRRAR